MKAGPMKYTVVNGEKYICGSDLLYFLTLIAEDLDKKDERAGKIVRAVRDGVEKLCP